MVSVRSTISLSCSDVLCRLGFCINDYVHPLSPACLHDGGTLTAALTSD